MNRQQTAGEHSCHRQRRLSTQPFIEEQQLVMEPLERLTVSRATSTMTTTAVAAAAGATTTTTTGYFADESSSGDDSPMVDEKLGLVIHISAKTFHKDNKKKKTGVGDLKKDKKRRRRRRRLHRHATASSASMASLRPPAPSPIHPDIDVSLTKVIKTGESDDLLNPLVAAKGTNCKGTDDDRHHHPRLSESIVAAHNVVHNLMAEHSNIVPSTTTGWRHQQVLPQQVQPRHEPATLEALSSVLQSYLEALENTPASSVASSSSSSSDNGNNNEPAVTSDLTNGSNDPSNSESTSSDRNTASRKRKKQSMSSSSSSSSSSSFLSAARAPSTALQKSTEEGTYGPPGPPLQKQQQSHRPSHLISDVVTYSDRHYSLEDALDLSDTPRVLLEASPPHRVVHANAAFSKLVIWGQQKRPHQNNSSSRCPSSSTTPSKRSKRTIISTQEWIRQQNTPPPSSTFSGTPTMALSNSLTTLTTTTATTNAAAAAAAAALAWKNRSLQDAIDRMIPDHIWGHGQPTMTCYPVRVGRAVTAAAADAAVDNNDDSDSVGHRSSRISHYLIEGNSSSMAATATAGATAALATRTVG